jgi:hypothetical protein
MSVQEVRKFKYVFIPADNAISIETRELEYTEESIVGCFGECVKAHFGTVGATADAGVLKAQALAQMKAKGQAMDDIPDETMSKLLNMTAFDCIPLTTNKKENDWLMVNLYVDDFGVAKQLPLNERASSVTVMCGRPARVMGDCFLARCQDDNNDLFKRVDIAMGDVREDAPWVVVAKKQGAALAAAAAASTGVKPGETAADATKRMLLAQQKALEG